MTDFSTRMRVQAEPFWERAGTQVPSEPVGLALRHTVTPASRLGSFIGKQSPMAAIRKDIEDRRAMAYERHQRWLAKWGR